MKERPILFQGAMVRGVLREVDPKTQTRRIAKADPQDDDYRDTDGWPLAFDEGTGDDLRAACPYGARGDRLWVRETARCIGQGTDFENKKVRLDLDYKAGGGTSVHFALDTAPGWFPGRARNANDSPRWAPGIHMPRWASRILLEVTNVRVERLQDICEADAWAEGCQRGEPTDNGGFFPAEEPDPSGIGLRGWDNAVDWYADLWTSINGETGTSTWDANPWVWVVEFKRVTS